jgi:hypothetical protein
LIDNGSTPLGTGGAVAAGGFWDNSVSPGEKDDRYLVCGREDNSASGGKIARIFDAFGGEDTSLSSLRVRSSIGLCFCGLVLGNGEGHRGPKNRRSEE